MSTHTDCFVVPCSELLSSSWTTLTGFLLRGGGAVPKTLFMSDRQGWLSVTQQRLSLEKNHTQNTDLSRACQDGDLTVFVCFGKEFLCLYLGYKLLVFRYYFEENISSFIYYLESWNFDLEKTMSESKQSPRNELPKGETKASKDKPESMVRRRKKWSLKRRRRWYGLTVSFLNYTWIKASSKWL